MKTPNNQYEIGVSISLKNVSFLRETVTGLFLTLPIDLSSLVEQEDRKRLRISVFVTRNSQALKILKTIQSWKLKKMSVFIKLHRKKDWSTRWKKGWKPFALTKKIFVVPLWLQKKRIPKGKLPVYLDTTNAFGTGLHETTKFTSQLIESLEGKFHTFLDVGTGTGILVAVAKNNGAGYTAAFDIDPQAVAVAKENLAANGILCDRLVASDVKHFHSKRPFELVAANLVTHDLLSFRKQIIRLVKPGGFLIISGISLGNVPPIKKSFFGSPLKCMKTLKGKEWSAFLFKVNKAE